MRSTTRLFPSKTTRTGSCGTWLGVSGLLFKNRLPPTPRCDVIDIESRTRVIYSSLVPRQGAQVCRAVYRYLASLLLPQALNCIKVSLVTLQQWSSLRLQTVEFSELVPARSAKGSSCYILTVPWKTFIKGCTIVRSII
jgi:hypothetical protein